jgi:hypothetical protein
MTQSGHGTTIAAVRDGSVNGGSGRYPVQTPNYIDSDTPPFKFSL